VDLPTPDLPITPITVKFVFSVKNCTITKIENQIAVNLVFSISFIVNKDFDRKNYEIERVHTGRKWSDWKFQESERRLRLRDATEERRCRCCIVESSLDRRIFGEEGEEGSSPAIFSCTFPNFENCNCNHVKKGFNCLSNRRNSRRMCQKKK
jgi:hypothetical protein